jgi:DNA polymerase-3 subunit epsilon
MSVILKYLNKVIYGVSIILFMGAIGCVLNGEIFNAILIFFIGYFFYNYSKNILRWKSKEDVRILFFDTETTGLPKNWKAPVSDTANWPRLVQIAWLVYDANGLLISEENHIIKPVGFKIPKSASDIHKITNKIAEEQGVLIPSVLEKFKNVIQSSDLLVAHNISYDENIMGAEYIRYGHKNILSSKRKFCTMKSSVKFCAIPGFKGYKWPKLIELYRKLFSKDFNQHNALDDIKATADCFWELKKRRVIKLVKLF